MDPYKVLDLVVKRYLCILNENLIGVYLHGSLAMGCYTERSDIDFLVVVNNPIDFETKRSLIDELLIRQELPEKGIEMSVILMKYAQDFQYPTPFELHYSDTHKEKYQNDKSYICGDYVDNDLAAHMTITKHRGICLYGKQIPEVFTDIPERYYIDSILSDIANSKEEITHNPVYYSLNLCRVLLYLKCHIISSKLEGGIWGIANLPQTYNQLLKTSVGEYQTELCFEQWNNEELIDFADYMLREIYGLVGSGAGGYFL